MDNICDNRQFAFLAGRAMFKRGEPCPANIWTDAEWRLVPNEGMCRWLGWMLERGMTYLHQKKIKDKQQQIREWAENNGSLFDI